MFCLLLSDHNTARSRNSLPRRWWEFPWHQDWRLLLARRWKEPFRTGSPTDFAGGWWFLLRWVFRHGCWQCCMSVDLPCLFVDAYLLMCEVGGGSHPDDDFDGWFFHDVSFILETNSWWSNINHSREDSDSDYKLRQRYSSSYLLYSLCSIWPYFHINLPTLPLGWRYVPSPCLISFLNCPS